ncbi:MAG TPA: hypothetical protein VNN15_07990 [Solirubrobacterales bacterium]|nr:hypothetical protein [Solirubrobacterales bacterium]
MRRWALTLLLAGLGLAGLIAGCGSTSSGEDANAGWIPGLEGVKSGEIEAALSLRGPGEGDQLYMRVLAMFLGAGEGNLPRVDGSAEATGQVGGEKVDFYTALITGSHRAAVTYEKDVYEMGPKTFDVIGSSFERALDDGTAADPYACLEAATRIDLSRIAGKATERDSSAAADDKTKVVHVTTELKPATLSAALRELTEDPGCGAQLKAAGPLQGQLEAITTEFENNMEEGSVETFVSKDGLLRELRAKAVVDLNGKGKTEAEFVYSVSHVNEIDELPPCTGEKQIEALFHKLGYNPLQAIEAGAPGLAGLLKGIYAKALA